MSNSAGDFELIETLRWSRKGGYYLRARHLDRLENSARELGFKYSSTQVIDCLDQAITGFNGKIERVRLLLHRDGTLSLTHTPITLPAPGDILTFAISDKCTMQKDSLLQHKTTRREFFDRERVRLQKLTGCDEALFTNEHGEITEGSIMTVFLELNGVLKTPQLSCGLLPGTLRAELLEDPARKTEEAILNLSHLAQADRIWLGNSVRGLIKARSVS